MTDASSLPSPNAPRELLADLGDLTRRVRDAQRGTWFPLLLLGVLTLGGILVDRLTFSIRAVPCAAGLGGTCQLARQGSPVYWFVGLLLAYAATAWFYVRTARARGVGTTVRPYVVAGCALVLLVGAPELWGTVHLNAAGAQVDFLGLRLDADSGPARFLERFTGSAAAVGLPLLVLSWIERSRALLLFTLVYLAVELVPLAPGWAGPWSGLPRLGVPGVLLLLAALGFALTRLPRKRTAS